jgi:hypothetical protein
MAYSTRSSKRLKTQIVKYTEDDEDDGLESGKPTSNDDLDATSTKSRATGPPRVGTRRKKGLLAQLTEFPLDVLLEVCTFLVSFYEFDGLTAMADFQGAGSP